MGINKDLGLPFGDGMEKTLIAFDVDGTLVNGDEKFSKMLVLLACFVNQEWKNVEIAVWSGGGAEYAETMTKRFLPEIPSSVKYFSKLQHTDLRKKYAKIVAFDDVQDTRLGDVNLIVRNK